VRFVAEHADRTTVDGLRWGVEPICRVLTEHGTPIAPSTFTTPAPGGATEPCETSS
jgi:putative transposase